MRRRATVGLLALVAWVVGTAFASVGPVVTAPAQAGVIVGQAHANFAPSLTGSKPIVVLAIGSGARPGEDVVHSLSDSIHLIFLNPSSHKASIVGVPRDSYVPIPGLGTNKINDAMVAGGPPLLIQTLESNFGVHIDYWALTTFWGMDQMINSIGGLDVNVPFPMKDSYSGANFTKGKHHLTGPQVLAFSRDRHSLNSGDFGRSEDGGRVFLAALAQFKTEFAKDQGRLFAWLAAGMKNMQTTLKLSTLVDLAFTASHVALKDAQNVVLPGGTGMVGSLSVVHIDTAKARAIIADAQKDGVISKANVPPSPTAGE
jgi:polyisoprenyl-teichoic acid--peptidoglycan teichoic acid transferase